MACVALAKQLIGVERRVSERDRPEAYQERLDRIGEIFSSMMVTVDGPVDARAARTRIASTSARPSSAAATSASREDPTASSTVCGGDDKIDYRSAWDTGCSRPAGRCAPVTRTLFDDARTSARCGCRRRAGAAGAAASASSRCTTAPSTSRRRPSRRRSCAGRSGSPARRVVPTPEPTVDVRRRAPPAAHRRRPRPDAAYGPIDPVGTRRRRHRALRRRRRSRRAATGVYGIASTSARRPSCSSSSTCDDGRAVEVVALENPQRFGGSDVMNRISYDEGRCGGELRQRAAQGDQPGAARALRAPRHRPPRGLRGRDRRQRDDARPLLRARRRARSASGPTSRSTELELLDGRRDDHGAHRDSRTSSACASHPQARVWGAPLIASHVGADVTADLVADRLRRTSAGISMLVDVGTNTEVVRRRPRPRSSPRAARPGRRSRAARSPTACRPPRARSSRSRGGRRRASRYDTIGDAPRRSGSAAPG